MSNTAKRSQMEGDFAQNNSLSEGLELSGSTIVHITN
jgi:hypothetical protein